MGCADSEETLQMSSIYVHRLVASTSELYHTIANIAQKLMIHHCFRSISNPTASPARKMAHIDYKFSDAIDTAVHLDYN